MAARAHVSGTRWLCWMLPCVHHCPPAGEGLSASREASCPYETALLSWGFLGARRLLSLSGKLVVLPLISVTILQVGSFLGDTVTV